MKQVAFIYRVMPLTLFIFLVLLMAQVGFHFWIFMAWFFFTLSSLSFAKRLCSGGRNIGRYGLILSLSISLVTAFFSFKIWQLIIGDQIQNRLILPAQEGLIFLMTMAIAYAYAAIKLINHSRS